MKAEIVKVGEKYGVRLESDTYADIDGAGHTWNFPRNARWCLGSLAQAKAVMAYYKAPVVIDLDAIKPVEPWQLVEPEKIKTTCPWRTHINIDRHDLYFFLAAQVVVILLAGVYFK